MIPPADVASSSADDEAALQMPMVETVSSQDQIQEAIYTCKFPGCTRQYASTDGAPRSTRAGGAARGAACCTTLFGALPPRAPNSACEAVEWPVRRCCRAATPPHLQPALPVACRARRRAQALSEEPSGVATGCRPREGQQRMPMGGILHPAGDH